MATEEQYYERFRKANAGYHGPYNPSTVTDVLRKKYNIEIKNSMMQNYRDKGLILLPDQIMGGYHPNVFAEIMTYWFLKNKNLDRFRLTEREKNVAAGLNATDIAFARLQFYYNAAAQHDRSVNNRKDEITIDIPYDYMNFCTNMKSQIKYWEIRMKEPKMQMTGYNLEFFFEQRLHNSQQAEFLYYPEMNMVDDALIDEPRPYQKIFLFLYKEIEDYMVEYWIEKDKKIKKEIGLEL